ncbi:atrial natriuretic peptide receptor 3, partial [Biomphalaria pfeifferi]
ITSGAMAGDFKANRMEMYQTLTRVGTNYNELSSCLISIFKYYNYHNVVLFYDGDGHSKVMYKLCHVVINAMYESFL